MNAHLKMLTTGLSRTTTTPMTTIKLNPCPMCGSRADVQNRDLPKPSVFITCSRIGCFDVIAPDLESASKLWNEKRFNHARS